MNQILLKTNKASKDKEWMKMHLLFSFVIALQFYTIHHKIEHLKKDSSRECVQCILSVDYFDLEDTEVNIIEALTHFQYVLNLNQLIPQLSPNFYLGRAPPIFC